MNNQDENILKEKLNYLYSMHSIADEFTKLSVKNSKMADVICELCNLQSSYMDSFLIIVNRLSEEYKDSQQQVNE